MNLHCKVKLLHHHTTKTDLSSQLFIGNISQACIIMERIKNTKLYEDSIVKVKFRYHPEYVEKGMNVLF